MDSLLLFAYWHYSICVFELQDTYVLFFYPKSEEGGEKGCAGAALRVAGMFDQEKAETHIPDPTAQRRLSPRLDSGGQISDLKRRPDGRPDCIIFVACDIGSLKSQQSLDK